MQTLLLANPTCGLFPRPQLRRLKTSLKDSRRELPQQAPLRSIRCAAAVSLGGDDGETYGGTALKYPRRHVWNPYKRLGLSPDASEEEIREARNFLLQQYVGHESSMESIEDAYDKLLMASFRQRKKTKMNLKSRLKRKVEESPPWIKRLLDFVEFPPVDVILRRLFLFAFMGAWSIMNSAETGPAFQLALSLGSCIYFLNDKMQNVARACIMGFGALVLGWLCGSIVVPAIPSFLLHPSWTLELLTSLLNINPLKETELIFYGGEFYNGQKTFVYGDLYRYDIEKNEWKLISSPNSPPPRSAHQAVAWKDHIYIFGGEFTSPNQERFHHYKDFWMFDLKSNQWEQLLMKGCPSARSGHRMVLYKHKIIVFGGFYDTLREVRYFNDLHVFDLDHFKWQEIKPKPGCMWPSARSGFQLFVFQDEIFLYGGYSKEIASDKNGSEKGIVHSDMWSLDPRTWEWNKVKKAGMPPGPRAGFSMCMHKKRALLFGGVVDMEIEGDEIMSLFINELYGFQLDCQRWYPLELRKDKGSKDKIKGTKKPENDGILHTKNNQNVVQNPVGHEQDESMESCEAEDKKCGNHVVPSHMMKSLTVSNGVDNSAESIPRSSINSEKQIDNTPETVKPCGRINASMVVGRDTLYIYGGMMEVKDREITLDDLYMLNLSKLDEWKCIIPASKSEWLEVSEDEDEDEDEDEGDESADEDSCCEEDGDESEDDEEEKLDGETTMNMGDAVSILRGEGKNLRRKEKKTRIEQIRASLGLSDSQRTPTPGETLKDFYRRTNLYWQMAAHEHTQHTGKELRKDGFDLAEARFKELKPVLDELAILEAEQKAEEEESAETSTRKKNSKKSDRQISRR